MRLTRAAWTILMLVISVALFDACGRPSDLEPDPVSSGGPNSAIPVPSLIDCSQGTTLSWDNFGRQFIRRYCSGCHSASLNGSGRQGAPTDMNFDTHAEALEFRVDMLLHAASNGAKMPPGVPVGRDERALFSEWLKCGAP